MCGMKSSGCMSDLLKTMRATDSQKTARTILTFARNRLGDIQFLSRHGSAWPALEQNLQAELDELISIAERKGFAL
jgi:hypothetical protein